MRKHFRSFWRILRQVFPIRMQGKKCSGLTILVFNIWNRYPVLKDVNLVLDDRSTAIIGQNGAGKTTLVKLLKGLLKPVSGSIYYGGEDISGKTVAMLAGEVGYVFQNPDDQIFKYHVMDEIMFGPLNIGEQGRGGAEITCCAENG